MKSNKHNEISPARLILMKSGYRWEFIDSVQDKYSDSISIEAYLQEG